MRKLASIQRVWDVKDIEDSDFLQLYSVEGWQVVGNKGDFQKGDLAVYFEIDSFLPVRPEFEFLRDGCYKNNELNGEGFLLRTRNFRGQVSQGLVLPLSIGYMSEIKILMPSLSEITYAISLLTG